MPATTGALLTSSCERFGLGPPSWPMCWRQERISQIEALCAQANTISLVDLDGLPYLVQVANHFAEAEANSRYRMLPVGFCTVIRQQQAACLASSVAEILPDQLVTECTLQLQYIPVVGNLYLNYSPLNTSCRSQLKVGTLAIGYLRLPYDSICAIRSVLDTTYQIILYLILFRNLP